MLAMIVLHHQEEEFFSRARTKKELCEFLNCTPDFIDDAIRAKKLRAYKFTPRFMRFMPDDLREWFKDADVWRG